MITWTESYELGIAKVDEQHRSLVDKINELHAAMRAGKGRASIGSILDFLGEYAMVHFATEESLMERHGYPEMRAHEEEHEKFRQNFRKMTEELANNPQSIRIAVDVEHWLSQWIANHLKKVDKKTMEFLISKGVK